MHLKRIQAHGFKSFAAPIAFDLTAGVTGIVGPNGCGKSNVVDAIKWALGDMSTKSLRGEEMLDVIFGGAAGVAAMGFAEVSLTFDNADRRLPIEFDEVLVTRRLHRTGESEYLLNKAPCRLRDIRELFYGTGVGRDCYSVIEQGRIGFLIQGTPKERRAIFEEASGISRYRARKREAESKLERVGQDLEVLGVQIQEIEREIRSLKIQAGKAERYRQHQAAIREKRLALALHEYDGLAKALETVRSRLASLDAERAEAARALEEVRAAVGAGEAELRQRQEGLSALHARVLAAAQEATALQEGIKHEEQRQEELAAEGDRAAAEREQKAAATRQAEERLAAARTEIEQARAAAEATRVRLAETEQMLSQADAACAEARQAIERRKGDAIEALRKRSEHQNQLVACEADQRAAAGRRESLDERLARLEADRAALRAAADALGEEVARRDRAIAEAKARLDDENARGKALSDDKAVLSADRERLREEHERVLARRDLLRGLEEQLEGLSTGARALLRSQEHAGAAFPGICGSLADVLRVDPPYVRAIESVLGERAAWLVAESAVAALAAVDHVRAGGLGAVGVVPRNVRAADPPTLPPTLPEGARPALDCVRVEPADASVARYILGGLCVVADRDAAIRFLREAPPGVGAVTLDGMTFGPEGTVGGGTRESTVSLLSRRAELATLLEEASTIEAALREKEEAFAHREAEAARCAEAAETLRTRIYEMTTVDLPTLRAQLEGDRQRDDVLAREIDVNRQERDQIEAQEAFLRDRRQSLERVVAEIDAFMQTLDAEVRSRTEELERFEASRADVRRRFDDLRLAVGAAEARSQSAAESVARQDEALAEARAAEAASRERCEDLSRRMAACAEARAERGQALIQARTERERLEQELRAGSAEGDALQTRLQADKRREASVLERERGLAQDLHAQQLQEQQCVLRIDNLERAAQDECGAVLADAYPGYRPPDGFDDAAIREAIAELRRKIEAMGNVNPAAIEELQAREERHTYLAAQQQDLVGAREKLHDLIRKINRESREMFSQTLEKIRGHFKVLFRKLFGGGNADIVLEEGVDLLEAGIDIVAKPPHKDSAKLDMLSGGEKTLATLALVLAIFRSNPTPFCVLDEADAALDEHNVDRFVGLVREFARDTQFLLITHNKRTMIAADVLYGVTMQTPGVSKRVVVNLEEIQNEAGEVTAIGTETAAAPAPELAGVGAGGAGGGT